MNTDLTVGRPSSVLWKFCLPLFGSVIFQQLYNIADSLVAGKFIGESALAAVGNSYEITLIFIAFATGCSIGCSVIVSQLFGSKEFGKMKTAVYTAMIGCACLCLLLMAAGIAFGRRLLSLIHTPDDIFSKSLIYLNIYIWSLPFLFFYNISNGIFSAMGDSRTPFWFLAISSVSNIAVDILFVTVFHMGVAGVAWATFLCQGVSCVLAVYFVLRRLRTIRTEGKVRIFSLNLLSRIAAVAIPSMLQQSFISIGNIIIQGVINGFGTAVIAGFSAAIKLNSLIVTSLVTLGNGISNYTAQNLGAGKLIRIRQGFHAGLRLMLLLCMPVVILYWAFPENLVRIFVNEPTAQTIKTGIQFLRIVSPFYFLVSFKLAADGVLRGTAMMKKFMITTFTDLLLRVSLAVILSKTGLGAIGIWCAWPVGWAAATVLSVLFYVKGPWSKAAKNNRL